MRGFPAPLEGAIVVGAARATGSAATVLAGAADASTIVIAVDSPTMTPIVTTAVRAQMGRLSVRIETAHRALAHLRALEHMPRAERDAIDTAVGDVGRTLLLVRRSLHALESELIAMEAAGRELVGRVYGRRAGRGRAL